MEVKSKVGCYFQVRKFKSDGTLVFESPPTHNLVLDSGLDYLAENSIESVLNTIRVGQGTSLPLGTQTSLEDEIASTGNKAKEVSWNFRGAPHKYWRGIAVFEFGQGAVEGTITEMGLGAQNALINRQLLRNVLGIPTEVKVLSDEILQVAAEFHYFPDMDDDDSEDISYIYNGAEVTGYREVDASQYDEGFRGHLDKTMSSFSVRVSEDIDAIGTAGTLPDNVRMDGYISGSFERQGSFIWRAEKFIGDIRTISVDGYSFFRLGTPITVEDDDKIVIKIKRSWGRI